MLQNTYLPHIICIYFLSFPMHSNNSLKYEAQYFTMDDKQVMLNIFH